jgi:hypothetical protein
MESRLTGTADQPLCIRGSNLFFCKDLAGVPISERQEGSANSDAVNPAVCNSK